MFLAGDIYPGARHFLCECGLVWSGKGGRLMTNSDGVVYECLSEKQLAVADEMATAYASMVRADGLDQNVVSQSLRRVYEALDKPAPHVLFCESLFQLAVSTGLLLIAAESDELASRFEKELKDPVWKSAWNKVCEALKDAPELSKSVGAGAARLKDGEPQKGKFSFSGGSLFATLFGEELDSPILEYKHLAISEIESNEIDRLGLRAKLQIRKRLRSDLETMQTRILRGTMLMGSISDLIHGELSNSLEEQLQPDTVELLKGFCAEYLASIKKSEHSFFGMEKSGPSVDDLFKEGLNTRYSHIDNFRTTMSGEVMLYGFLVDELGLGRDTKEGQFISDLALLESSGIEFSAYASLCLVCLPPISLKLSERGFLHNEHGPAIEFRDGFKTYAWQGVVVASHVIEKPETITLEEIDAEQNAEVRRILIQRYGMERYLEDSGARELDRDQYGVLYVKQQEGDEPIVMVKVINTTPEPDGTPPKTYFLRVPPYMRTAKEAVAWTFGMERNQYSPSIES